MSLEQEIKKICEDMKKAEWTEPDVEDYAVRPVLLALGWPNQLGIIRRQYRPEKDSKVDLVLYHPETKNPLVFIEAKNSKEKLEKHEEQLLKYVFKKGVPLAILTNGQNWKFYYPQAQAEWTERWFCNLNICEDELKKCVFRLERYLCYEEIVSGKAFAMIRTDWNETYIHRNIVDAWGKVKNEQSLIDAMEQKLTTVKNMDSPENMKNRIKGFLNDLTVLPPKLPASTPPTLIETLSGSRNPTSPDQDKTPSSSEKKFIGFKLNGTDHRYDLLINILVGVFDALTEIDSSFPQKFADSKFNLNKRRTGKPSRLSKNKEDFQKPEPRELDSGWWISRSNVDMESIEKFVKQACEVFSEGKDDDNKVTYGTELTLLYLPGGE